MSLSNDRSTLLRLNKEIASLRSKEASEFKKIADCQRRAGSARDSARRASSTSVAKMHISTAERELRNMQNAQSNQGKIAAQIASKSQDVSRVQERMSKDEERERRLAQAAFDKQQKAVRAADTNARILQERIDNLEAQISQFLEAEASTAVAFNPTPPEGESEAYDVFISHAWEDKDEFVRELAEKARAAGLRVWYDEFSIQWGDSLRQKIDAGLRSSYFGLAVLSPNFFAKNWTAYELDALVERSLTRRGRLLPIWHRITKDDVAQKAPSLANRLALNSSLMTADDMVEELVKLRDIFRSNG